jgi:hypothetical protein
MWGEQRKKKKKKKKKLYHPIFLADYSENLFLASVFFDNA